MPTAWSLILLLGIASALPAQKNVEVQCLGPDGRPVPGAEVHFFQKQGQVSFKHFGPYPSDAEGVSRCPTALTYDGGQWERLVYARVPGKLVGAGGSFSGFFGAINDEGPIQIRMFPTRSVTGRVRVPEGFDVTAVRVRVHSMTVFRDGMFLFSFYPNSHYPGLDTALPDILESTVAADGTFTVLDVPAGGQFYLVAEGEGLGQAQYANVPRQGGAPRDVLLEMAPEAVLHGRVLDPKGQPVAGATVSARMIGRLPGPWVLEAFRSRTDERGRFRLEGLPGLDFGVHLTYERQPWAFMPVGIVVSPGTEKKLELAFETGTRVTGIVADTQGKQLAGARITAESLADFRGPIAETPCDDQGRFALWLPAGRLKVYVSFSPLGYRPIAGHEIVVRTDQPVEDLHFVLKKS